VVVNVTGGDTWVRSMRCLKVGGPAAHLRCHRRLRSEGGHPFHLDVRTGDTRFERPLPTINFRVDYLRPAVNTALTVTARVSRSGRSVGVVDVDVLDSAQNVVAIGRAAYSTVG
jgi:acyl-coenzyme A thioesterase PaaI-like protein